MIAVANSYNQRTVGIVNEIMGLNLPMSRKNYVTIFDNDPELQELPINQRLGKLLDYYPTSPVMMLLCKVTEDEEEAELHFEQKMFPSDWKMIPRLLKRNTDVMFFISPYDYIWVKPNLKIKKASHNGVSKIIESIILDMKYPTRLTDIYLLDFFQETCHLTHSQAIARIQHYEQLYYLNKLFVARIEMIYSCLDVSNLNIIQETVRKCNDLDLFKVKLLYVMWFQKSRDLSLIKRFTGTQQPNEYEHSETQHNAREACENFVELCNKFLNMSLDVDSLFEDVEEILMDSTFLSEVYGDSDDEESEELEDDPFGLEEDEEEKEGD